MKLRAHRQGHQGVLATAGRRSHALAQRCLAGVVSLTATFRQAMLELTFPPQCVGCSAQLPPERPIAPNMLLCDDCVGSMSLFEGPVCRRCGAPVPDLGTRRDDNSAAGGAQLTGCYRCRGSKHWFDETIAAGLYAGRMRELLLRMKHAEGDAISLAMGRLLWAHCGSRLKEVSADVVVPIPLHWRRRLMHRTNSATRLGEVIAGKLALPLAEDLLRRRRHTKRQFDLTPSQRWHNVRRAFSVRAGYHLTSARVLLVDDILTTGATCSEAARSLRSAGARHVAVVVVARAYGEFAK